MNDSCKDGHRVTFRYTLGARRQPRTAKCERCGKRIALKYGGAS